jgi:reversibly glycosylated polypeptide/UDP-arabinopyranose mutase
MLVVPSNREECLQRFLKAWEGVEPIVIEDGPQKTFKIDVKHHYSWAEIDADLKDKAWVISRRDGAVRCYGFLVAYRLGEPYIFTTDDDCFPITEEHFFKEHARKMGKTAAWAGTVLGFRTRGIPYRNLGTIKNVVASIGLWKGVPDIDSVDSLQIVSNEPNADWDKWQPSPSDRLLPYGQYFPISSMNLAFKREIAVLSFFPLSGEGYPFRRFDDIWFGIILKKICDHLRLNIAVGHPYVRHLRASDPFVNLVKEAPGIAANETFWETIDAIPLTATTPAGCMLEVGNRLCHNDDAYLKKLGEAIKVWVGLFS